MKQRALQVIDMKLENFFDWNDVSSKFKLGKTTPRPVQIILKRGEKTMQYKTKF